MVVGEAINNIMGGIENTGSIKQHNHKKKLRQRFDIIKKLGQGTFGKVQLGINKETGQEVAIKTIKKSKIESDADLVRIRREIQIMSSVQHPNIIHIYEVFENREKMVLVMEYAAGGELYDYLSERKVLDEEEARRIFRQIATACYYCHKHKICHRDLKLENILLDESNNAKIADFGLSNVFDDQRLLNTFCGSPLYASPEIVKGTPYHGPEVDCWSLGVLLYTLVYGAMPFDGSNFKRLVKQISQGDYFEPTKPSPASPLIRDMLTVNPKNRADIEKICTHWWVNEGYDDSCLDISEELANQTPVRLDVLLSLAPPAPQLESDKLMVTGDEEAKMEPMAPARSQSVGSLMELGHPAERRIIDLIKEDKVTPKRKLETTVSTDRANLDKRKDKIVKENTVADITVHGTIRDLSIEDASMSEALPLNKSLTQTLSREMDVEQTEVMVDPSLQGAACSEIIEEAEKKKQSKIKRTLSTNVSNKVLEGISEIPSQENVASNLDKENVQKSDETQESPEKEEKTDTKPVKKKMGKKKVLGDKNENAKQEVAASQPEDKPNEKGEKTEAKEQEAQVPSKPVERRKSRIFEAAEKFQNLISPPETKPKLIEKPKKVIIPGVSVDGYKKEFERKASLTSNSASALKGSLSKSSLDKKSDEEIVKDENEKETKPEPKKTDNNEIKERMKNAVSIISSALEKEGARKSKSRPCMMRKPPVPFGVSGRSASGNIAMISPMSPPPGPKPYVKPVFDKPEAKQVVDKPEPPIEENKTSSAEITFKSATLPRKKTKAEIQLNYPLPKPTAMGFKTEMAHNVQVGPTQRSEVIVPVSAATRPTKAEEILQKRPSKEIIIPIAFENENNREGVQSPPTKPPMPKAQTQKANGSQRNSLSRQSTQESDSETVGSIGEPIRKSPREYIIPIAVEGGGYVTPRAGSLEPSDTTSTASTMTNKSKTRFGRARRMNSLFSDRDSEDESSPFSTLHRHGSVGKDSDTEDSKSAFHMHRLRSTRPKRSNLEHNDSVSSGEEDDDDGFEILTAENLFSTLLSRVRDLTQRLNVDDGVRPGFPSSRLLSHFDHGTNFWNRMDHPLTRHSSLGRTLSRDRPVISNSSTGSSFGVPWRRSVSRDLASDIDSVFKNSKSSGPRPTGDDVAEKENLNLADLDLKKLKLSDEDALALSYLTPGLSRRIQKQLLAQLAPSEVRKLQRTLSSRTSDDSVKPSVSTRSQDRMSSTLPRRFSFENKSKSVGVEDGIKTDDLIKSRDSNIKSPKSFLPIKNREGYTPSYEFNIRSASIGSEPRVDNKFSLQRPKITKSLSVREPKRYNSKPDIQSPESSLSESLSSSYRNTADSIESSSKGFSDSSASRPYSKYSSEPSYSRYSPHKSYDSSPSFIPSSTDTSLKTDIKKPSINTRRVSRFLRPDFFEPPKEENIYFKEKKERELETQKVLKEIRDKRKGRLNLRRERSASRETQSSNDQPVDSDSNKKQIETVKETESLLNNVSDSIKNLEDNVKNMHDYVNVPGPVVEQSIKTKETVPKSSLNHDYVNTSKVLHDYVNMKTAEDSVLPTMKKEKVSRIARPKSYPSDNLVKEKSNIIEKEKLDVIKKEKQKGSPEKESKVSKLRKGFNRQTKEKTKEDKNITNKNINEEEKGHKNKLLQSIEKKLEKFRSSNIASNKNPEEVKALQEKKSTVENAIRRLREQSLPRSLEHCTESGLIKRAVSVEDISSGSKPLQASRKSVTKILGLFKKYEEQESKPKEKVLKKSKNKENGNGKNKPCEKENDTSTQAVIMNNEINDIASKETESIVKNDVPKTDSSQSEKSDKERPRSLLFDKVKHFQNVYNGAKSDTVLNSEKDKQLKVKSKLPVNSFRRSLNLDNLPEPSKFSKNSSKSNISDTDSEQRPNRKSLKLDFSQIPSKSKPLVVIDTTDSDNKTENQNSFTATDESSTMLSPGDDYLSCDSWSVCSDFHHTNDLTSPVSPNGHIYSGDENESVIDRIRRKSFYTRFNEKKRPRRASGTHNYKDLDLSYRSPTDYGSLDRRTYDYRSPISRRSGYTSIPEPPKDYRYSRSPSLLNDYVNVPNRYQTYSSKIGRPASSIYSDSEDNTLDDLLSTAKSRKYSAHIQPSRLSRTSVSPVNEYYFDQPSSSVVSPTTSEPI